MSSYEFDRERWVQPSSEWTVAERENLMQGLFRVIEHAAVQCHRMAGAEVLNYMETLQSLHNDSAESLESRREKILRLANFTHAPLPSNSD